MFEMRRDSRGESGVKPPHSKACGAQIIFGPCWRKCRRVRLNAELRMQSAEGGEFHGDFTTEGPESTEKRKQRERKLANWRY